MRNTDADWEVWGKNDPYFGVVTDEKYRGGKINETRSDFMQSGEDGIRSALERLERRFGSIEPGAALDFGSGVGRLTLPLGRRFSRAVGVDVSESMLAEARRNAAEMPNVEFVKSDDDLTMVSGQFDLVHSHIAIQHIPTARGMHIMDRLLSLCRMGGVALLDFPVQRTPTLVGKLKYFVQHNIFDPKRRRAPAMQMNIYDLVQVVRLFEKHGFDGVHVETDHQGMAILAHVSGRKIK